MTPRFSPLPGDRAVLLRSVLAALLIVAGLSAASIWSAHHDYVRVREDDVARSRISLHSVEQGINASLRQAGAVLQAAHEAYLGDDVSARSAARVLSDSLGLIDQARGYLIRSQDGRVLAEKGIGSTAFAAAELDEHFAAINRENVVYVSRLLRHPSGRNIVLLSRWFAARDRHPALSISLALAVEHFAPALAGAMESRNATATLVHDSGDVVLGLPRQERGPSQGLRRPGSFFSRHIDGNLPFTTHHGLTVTDGQERISSFKTLEAQGMEFSPRLVVELTELDSEVFEHWREDATRLATITGLLMLFGVAVVWLNHGRALQKERGRLFMQAITENAGVMVLGVDRAGIVQVFNQTAAAVIGLPESDVIGEPYEDVRSRVSGLPPLLSAFKATPGESELGGRVESRVARGGGRERIVAWTTTQARGGSDAEAYAIAFGDDVTERRNAEQHLRATERKLSMHLRQSMLGVIEWSPDLRIVEWNAAAAGIFGHSRDEALGRRADLIVPHAAMPVMETVFSNLLQQTGGRHATSQNLTRKGETILCEWFNTPLLDEAGKAIGVMSLVRDVTTQQRAEERLQSALQEKETLLREIYHRVKNNLQVVVSLLAMQARSGTRASPQALLMDSANRVKAIALAHELLYRSKDLARINFRAYMAELANHLARAHQPASAAIALRLEVAPVELGIDTAVPLGLICNELISNAYKHAFAGGVHGEIAVFLEACDDGRLGLTVSDNGCGLPADFRIEYCDSLGMRLVHSLSEQIDGELTIANEDGARFTIRLLPLEANLVRDEFSSPEHVLAGEPVVSPRHKERAVTQ